MRKRRLKEIKSFVWVIQVLNYPASGSPSEAGTSTIRITWKCKVPGLPQTYRTRNSVGAEVGLGTGASRNLCLKKISR